MTVSENQELPHHIRKRELIGREIYDLTFDYDFARVPRDLGESLMRIDFSNEEGYWNNVVNKAGETKRKRSLEDVGRNHKRWLEDEWRDDVHFGALDKHEMHKRWFGSGVISWLKNLITTGTAKVTEELNHQVDETITAILVDEQWGPCPVGPATVSYPWWYKKKMMADLDHLRRKQTSKQRYRLISKWTPASESPSSQRSIFRILLTSVSRTCISRTKAQSLRVSHSTPLHL